MLAVPAAAYENSALVYQDGARAAQSGDMSRAIDIFKKVIVLSPAYSLGHYGLGKAYMHVPGKMRDAQAELLAAIECDRKMTQAYFYLGLAYYLDRKFALAIRYFDIAFKLDNSYTAALYNLYVIYEESGNMPRAHAYYRQYMSQLSRAASGAPF